MQGIVGNNFYSFLEPPEGLRLVQPYQMKKLKLLIQDVTLVN